MTTETTTTTDQILVLLNGYTGDDIWEGLIYGLDYNQDATNAIADARDCDVVIGRTHYTYDERDRRWYNAGDLTYTVEYDINYEHIAEWDENDSDTIDLAAATANLTDTKPGDLFEAVLTMTDANGFVFELDRQSVTL